MSASDLFYIGLFILLLILAVRPRRRKVLWLSIFVGMALCLEGMARW